MASSQFNEKRIISILRWLTRLMGVLLILVIILFALGEHLPNPSILTLEEKLEFIALFIMLAGLIFAWKYEAYGGLTVIAGYIFFCIIERKILGQGVFFIFPVVGLSFLLCWWRTKAIKANSNQE